MQFVGHIPFPEVGAYSGSDYWTLCGDGLGRLVVASGVANEASIAFRVVDLKTLEFVDTKIALSDAGAEWNPANMIYMGAGVFFLLTSRGTWSRPLISEENVYLTVALEANGSVKLVDTLAFSDSVAESNNSFTPVLRKKGRSIFVPTPRQIRAGDEAPWTVWEDEIRVGASGKLSHAGFVGPYVDVYTQPGSSVANYYVRGECTFMGDTLYFAKDDELWRRDPETWRMTVTPYSGDVSFEEVYDVNPSGVDTMDVATDTGIYRITVEGVCTKVKGYEPYPVGVASEASYAGSEWYSVANGPSMWREGVIHGRSAYVYLDGEGFQPSYAVAADASNAKSLMLGEPTAKAVGKGWFFANGAMYYTPDGYAIDYDSILRLGEVYEGGEGFGPTVFVLWVFYAGAMPPLPPENASAGWAVKQGFFA